MKAFRFRLASLQRLKKHAIENEERYLGAKLQEEEELLQRMERDRLHVVKQTEMFLERTQETHNASMERDFDLYRTYMERVKQENLATLARIRSEQEACRKRLLKLYQEEKILERLEERALKAHRREELREEIYMLDEIGSRTFDRRRREAGTVSSRIVFFVAFCGTIALYWVHHEWSIPGLLEKAGIVQWHREGDGGAGAGSNLEQDQERSRQQLLSERYTIAELLNDPNGSAQKLLAQIAEERTALREWREQLVREEAELRRQQEKIHARYQDIDHRIDEYNQKADELEAQEAAEEARSLAAREARLQEASTVLSKMQRNISDLLLALWLMPDDAGKELVISTFERMSVRERTKVLDSLGDEAPKVGAELAAILVRGRESEPTGGS